MITEKQAVTEHRKQRPNRRQVCSTDDTGSTQELYLTDTHQRDRQKRKEKKHKRGMNFENIRVGKCNFENNQSLIRNHSPLTNYSRHLTPHQNNNIEDIEE